MSFLEPPGAGRDRGPNESGMTNTILTLLSADRLAEHYRSGHWQDDTIYALAKAHADRTPDRFAIRDQFRRLTYRELLAAVDALAADLAARGVRPGQRVAVWLPSRIEAAVVMLACSRNGYVCVPSLHRDHTVADIRGLIERTRAAALFAQPGYGADADRHDIFGVVQDVASLRHVYRVSPLTTETASAPFADMLSASTTPPPPNGDPNRIVYLAFTSGTTGVPKGVMHSDNTLLATVRTVAKDWRLDAGTAVYTLSPLSHNLGMGALILAMTVGGELVIHDLPRKASLLDRLIETGATYLVGVPTHAIDLLSELRARGLAQLGKVKGFRISGAAVPGEVVAELLRYGVVPQSGYGMTETCSHQYSLPDDDPKRIIESSGRCCAGYEIRIWKQDNPDVEAPVGEIGQIGGRGASLMLGYFDDQAATEESFNSLGWFMTGDLGWMDEDGYLRITGRKKDVIIRGGHNIYPARIEALAMRHAAVERAVAFPVADARLGEKVCLAVSFRNGMTAGAEEILQHLDAAGLSKFDMPEYFLVPEKIPLTSSGKILKRELVAWVQEGRARPTPVRWQARS
jgi:acyl-CoA synthetase (AMP-forming)/AMP-acid ligase II